MIPYAAPLAVLFIAAAIVGIYFYNSHKLRRKHTSGVVRGIRETGVEPRWTILIDTPFGTQWVPVPRSYFNRLEIGFVGITWYTRTRITKRLDIKGFLLD